jgi:hypothetical protein
VLSAQHPKKPGVLVIVGSMFVMLIVGLDLGRTQPANAAESSRSTLIPQTAVSSEQRGEPVLGVFEGATPCSPANPPLPQIPGNAECEQMKWKLTLNQDPATGNPTTYQLLTSYGLPQQGTRDLRGGGTPLNLEGKWTTLRGIKANANAVVYQLNPDNPQEAISFIRMDDNVLHLLTQDKSLMVGSAAWSYTLNRTDKRLVSTTALSITGLISQATPPSPMQSVPSSPDVFLGRMPCADILLALNNVSAPGCQAVKVRLSLERDTETHAPTTFVLDSVYVGTGDTRYSVAGTWAILQGTTDPVMVIYQLNPPDAQQPLLLLRADENHLFLLGPDFRLMVGDTYLSYTLSRSG